MPQATVGAPAINDESGRATAVIEARELTREFGDVAVVKSLDLAIERGSIVGLIGPSGCGKTTTVRLLTGLLRPTSGEARLDGVPATALNAARRQRLGYLPQTPALFPDLSLWENLSFHASMYGLPLRRRRLLRSMLEWVELYGDRHKKVSQASGGMQRRLALAASLVHDPSVVFLDEPTAGIDPILREKFWSQFRTLGEAGKTMLITTQYVGEAAYCDYVGLLSDGELLMFDTPENLRRAAFEGAVVDITLQQSPSDADIARLEALPFVVGSIERDGPHALRVVVDGVDDEVAALNERLAAEGLDVEAVDEHVVDYDEAFVRIVERHRSIAEPVESDDDRDDRDDAERDDADRDDAERDDADRDDAVADDRTADAAEEGHTPAGDDDSDDGEWPPPTERPRAVTVKRAPRGQRHVDA